MTPETDLDRAGRLAQRDPDSAEAQLLAFDLLLRSELFVLLEDDDPGSAVTPVIFPLQPEPAIVAFDTEERLTGFAGGPAAYAALPGRALIDAIVGQEVALALNIDREDCALHLGAATLTWIADTMAVATPAPARLEDLESVTPPGPLDERFLASIGGRIATDSGLIGGAILTETARKSLLLALIDVAGEAQEAVARHVAEAVALWGERVPAVDYVFLSEGDPRLGPLRRNGIEIEIPRAPEPTVQTLSVPGSDPSKPPKLR